MPVQVMCDHCGKVATKKPDRVHRAARHYCSHACRIAGMTHRQNLICDQCGQPFQRAAHEVRRHKNNFCCHACSRAYLQRRVVVTCEVCGKQFERRAAAAKVPKHTFCSHACDNAWRIKRLSVQCLHCGRMIVKQPKEARKHPRHFCSLSCYHTWNEGEQSPAWQGGWSRFPYPDRFNNRLKRAIRERDQHTCQICGKQRSELTRALDVHHIDYDKNNCDPANLIALCSGCNLRCNYRRQYWRRRLQRYQQQRGLKQQFPRRGQSVRLVASTWH